MDNDQPINENIITPQSDAPLVVAPDVASPSLAPAAAPDDGDPTVARDIAIALGRPVPGGDGAPAAGGPKKPHTPPPAPPTPHGPATPRQLSTTPSPATPRQIAAANIAAQPDWKHMNWGDVFGRAGQAAGADAASNVGSIWNAITHPVETLSGIGTVGSGVAAQVGHKLTGQAYNPADAAKVAAARGVEQHFGDLGSGVLGTVTGDNIGDSAKLKKAIATAPVSTAMDASMFTPIPGAALKAASTAAKLAKAAELADTLGTAGNIASTAARWTDPVHLAMKGASGIVDAAGTLPRGIMAARSGMSSDLQKAAAKYGNNPLGRDSRTFLANATGIGGGDTVAGVKQLNNSLSTLNKAGFDAHQAAIAKMAGDVSLDPVAAAVKKAGEGLSPGGIDNGLNDDAHAALSKAQNAVDQHMAAESAYAADPVANADLAPLTGVQGLHKLKTDLYNLKNGLSDPAAKNAVGDVHAAALGELMDKVPGYSEAMENSQASMQGIKDMSKDLGINGGKSSTASTILKTLKKSKTATGANMLSKLNGVDSQILPMLAGQAARDWSHHGAGNLLAGLVGGPEAAMLAAVTSSPKITAALNYGAGMAGAAGSSAVKAARYPAAINEMAAPMAPSAPSAPSASSASSAPVSPAANQIADHIKQRETGGHSDPYSVVGPASTDGDHPYGAYQIMGKNIPEWTQEVLGHPMTPEEFVNNPDAQELVARTKIDQIHEETGSAADTASVWLSGKTLAHAGHRHDVLGTTPQEYAEDVTRGLPAGLFKGGRVGRASGGKVTPPRVHEMLVNRLMKLAKDAKTVSDKKTEPLLNAPDEHIVKALDVAQRAI